MDSLRIGLITGEYPPMHGGVGDFTHELARELTQQGHQPYVLTTTQTPSDIADEINVSGQVSGWNRAVFGTIRRWARDSQIDVINIQYEAAAVNMSQAI